MCSSPFHTGRYLRRDASEIFCQLLFPSLFITRPHKNPCKDFSSCEEVKWCHSLRCHCCLGCLQRTNPATPLQLDCTQASLIQTDSHRRHLGKWCCRSPSHPLPLAPPAVDAMPYVIAARVVHGHPATVRPPQVGLGRQAVVTMATSDYATGKSKSAAGEADRTRDLTARSSSSFSHAPKLQWVLSACAYFPPATG